MKRYCLYIACCLWTLTTATTLSAKDSFGFTKEHPVTIVCDWDFAPFEFLNSEGMPDGYNVEVLDLIFSRLGIPHQFVMQEWYVAMQMFDHRKADLIHALSDHYNHAPYVMTKKYINYYNVSVVRKVGTPPLFRLADLTEKSTLILKKDDYAELRMRDMDCSFKKEYRPAKSALQRIRQGKGRYFVWGEVPLKLKIKELGLDSLTMDRIDIPAGELRIVSYNKALIDAIDDQYTRLEQAGELEKIYDKWFHPERVHDDASPVTLYILGGLIVLGILIFLLNRLTTFRVRTAVRKSGEVNGMMRQALNMGDYSVMEYDIMTGHIRNVYGELLPEQGMSMYEFQQRLAPEELEDFQDSLDQMHKGKMVHWTMRKRFNAGTAESPEWRMLYGEAIVEYEKDQPRYIVNTVKDMTTEVETERRNQEIGARYMKIFETSMIAMSFYDAKGRLLDLNQKMRELCAFGEEAERHFRETSLFDAPLLKNVIEEGCREPMYVCQHLYYPKLGIDKYIETRILPVVDDADRLIYYVVTSRDLTSEREMYMLQREHEQRLHSTNAAISTYEERLHYLLKECSMYVWQFDFASRRINFAQTLGKVEFSTSIEEHMESIAPEEREQALNIKTSTVMKGQPFNVVHHFLHTPLSDSPGWYALNGLPQRDKQGRLTGYYGLARDVTYLMQTQQRLREETARAENSGLLKSAFLANMTHEIRTPLNAIVGFSGLLQMVEAPEERREFIRIIRSNCDMLLRLINDILEASSMGQSMTIEPEDIDLAMVFDDICQTLEQRVAELGVPFVKDNPYDTCPAVLDKGRLQQILTNFVTNAVKYTKQGHIRVGYRQEERDGRQGLYFYCEDTGTGIPKDKQSAVFERFVKLNDYVQGTGLGLSICKAIVDRCDGQIGVDSEGAGHGSTFWFWIPQA